MVTQKLLSYIHASKSDIMVYSFSSIVLFLGYSKARRGDIMPHKGNVTLLGGQLAQGQRARHCVARPLPSCACLGVNLLTMHKIKENMFSNLVLGNRHGLQAAWLLLSCFCTCLLCDCQKQELLKDSLVGTLSIRQAPSATCWQRIQKLCWNV